MTCACSRAASFASSLVCASSNLALFASNCAFSCWSCSYSAREMVTISAVLLVRISLFSMQTLYHRMRQKPVFSMVSTHFPCSDSGQSHYRAVGFRLLNF